MAANERIAVIGAGLMGHGIAQVFACAGYPVAVQDPYAAARDALHERIAVNLRRLGLSEAPLELVTVHERVEDAVSGAAYVVEAAPEDVSLKQNLIAQLTLAAGPDTIVASNTSSMPVALIAAKATGPGRVIGTHWWNPPFLIPLVEVVQGETTSDATVARTMALLKDVGKLPVHVRRDVPGFVANRLQHALWREAMALVQDGVCDAETVDLCVKNSFGLRLPVMGPLETADLGGLDMVLSIHEQVLPDIDRTPGPLQILKDKVAAGDLGMKTGRGFRDWTAEEADATRRRLAEHLAAVCGPAGRPANQEPGTP
jgi:3-hydroxybutyryl-CoA dehydrogenase